ncbi:HNH endonuclease [Kitasatospora sp. NPDC056273]|uniref:HNH endonuclease n=1 Tax=Kitasatospora sp. NPDC056273 TaxID=3345769 RepID=UPI0035D58BEF
MHGDAGCFHCSAALPEGGVIDHLIPISRGGVSTVANMRVVCVPCNASKKDQLMDEWNPLSRLAAPCCQGVPTEVAALALPSQSVQQRSG